MCFHIQVAASHDVMPALYNIANAYASGRGVEQSDKQAIKFYNASIAAGDRDGMFTLGAWL